MYRILHIFSESDDTSLVKSRLRESGEGIKIESAVSISDALDAAATESFDCIVVEDNEGGDNGLALLRTLRNRHIDTPVILSSQGSVENKVVRAYQDDQDAHVEILGSSEEPFRTVLERVIYHRAERTAKSSRVESVVENPHLYRLLYETQPVPQLILDADGRIAAANSAAVAMLKYRSSVELVGNPVIKLFPLAYNSSGMADVRALMNLRTAGFHSYRWKMITKNGEYCSLEAVGYPLTFENAKLTVITLRESRGMEEQVSAAVGESMFLSREAGSAQPLQVLVVCDGMVMRSGLQLMLGKEKDSYQFVEYSENAIKEGLSGPYDSILFARSSFNEEGLAQLRDIISMAGQTPVLLATLTGTTPLFLQALKIGARGIVQTETEFEAIPQAVHLVTGGAYWLPRTLVKGSIDQMNEPLQKKDSSPNPLALLTRREREILGLLAQGHKNKRIADKLGLSYRTVVTHVYNIYRKLKISSRTEAIHYAIMNRVIELD